MVLECHLGCEDHDLNPFGFHPHQEFDPNSSISSDSALTEKIFPLFGWTSFFSVKILHFSWVHLSRPSFAKQNIWWSFLFFSVQCNKIHKLCKYCIYVPYHIFLSVLRLPLVRTLCTLLFQNFFFLFLRKAEDLVAVWISSCLAAKEFLLVFNLSSKVPFRKSRGCYWQNLDKKYCFRHLIKNISEKKNQRALNLWEL